MQTGSGPAPVHLFMAAQRFKSRPALLALALVAFFTTAASAQAARSVYFADMTADSIAQFAVGPGGSLTALAPGRVGANGPRRLAMTPTGADLYATADDSVLQFDVGAGGQLTAKAPALVAANGDPHSIAVHPAGHSAYVTDPLYGKVRQYTIGPGGVLVPKSNAVAAEGSCGSARNCGAPQSERAKERARSELANLQSELERETARDPDPYPSVERPKRTWRWYR